jgi:prepilin signal peptidase PulO-like enzyme (type II secretory pathway)
LWILLVSAASHHARTLPKPLCYLGFVVGLAGILTVAPPLNGLGVVFGLAGILWFAWIGVAMLQQRKAY